MLADQLLRRLEALHADDYRRRVIEPENFLLYASINGQLDVEALGYMLVYFLHGRLPWQGLNAKDDAKYQLVLEQKQTISVSRLCSGLPVEFTEYISDVKDSRDTGKPDYQRLRKMFSKLSSRQGFEYDNVFDWTIRGFERLELNKETSNDVDAN
ncbi:hypothetical protein H2202_007459 [Exophiala xenobiotica]|nr:hypothetical protein H2202_007459 [Exophiala xenobiotica]